MNENNAKFMLPAEWAEQCMVQLTWPHEETDWRATLDDITKTYVEMAIEIAKREKLLIVAPEPTKAIESIRPYANDDIMRNIMTFACPTNDTWARDHGFITLTCGHRKKLLDFRFNGWGEKFESTLDNAINRQMYNTGIVEGDYDDNLDFVLEGGSIESDGKGTVLTTRCCLLAPHRNQPLTEEQIEQRLKRTLGAERIVWLECEQMEGDDTDGHIDTMVRIAPNDTLLVVKSEELMVRNSIAAAQAKYSALKSHFSIKILPTPRPIIVDGEILPATYANFLVINGAVLCPTYNQPDLDSKAMEIIGSAFPCREIVGIDCRSIIVQHGSLHCCTMQFPK